MNKVENWLQRRKQNDAATFSSCNRTASDENDKLNRQFPTASGFRRAGIYRRAGCGQTAGLVFHQICCRIAFPNFWGRQASTGACIDLWMHVGLAC